MCINPKNVHIKNKCTELRWIIFLHMHKLLTLPQQINQQNNFTAQHLKSRQHHCNNIKILILAVVHDGN